MKSTLDRILVAGFFALATVGSAHAQGDCNMTANLVFTAPSCGNSDGSVQISPVSGIAPFTYYLNGNVVPTGYITDLASGTYDYWVQDAAGCWVKSDFTLECEVLEPCQFRTQTQGGWGATPQGNNPAKYLQNHFAACFPNGITIGCATANTLTLTSSTAVKNFLPSGSTPSMLPNDMVNPGGSYNNVLAGQLVAATINVQADACDPNFGPADTWLGDAVIVTCDFAGWTVQSLLDGANQFIGGCGGSNTASQYNDALTMLNENYVGGTVNNGNIECKKAGKSAPVATGSLALSAYPNPTNGSVTLTMTAEGPVELSVMDLLGRTVLDLGKVKIDGAIQIEIDLSGLQEGSYLINMARDGRSTSQRIMIAR